MIGNNCLLDTSVIIQAFRKDNTIAQKLDELSDVFVPIIVVGELLYGAYKSSNTKENLQQVELFLQNCRIKAVDSITAVYYGKIKTALYNKGKPLPENDIWIAAMAQQYSLPLFTTDKHFQEVDSIMLL